LKVRLALEKTSNTKNIDRVDAAAGRDDVGPGIIRKGLLAVATAAAASSVAAPALAQQSRGPDRLVVTAPRLPQRPSLVVYEGFRDHLQRCWPGRDYPADAPEVRMRLFFRQDGTFAQVPVALPRADGLDEHDETYVRAVAATRQSLVRCEPYDFLPRKEYQHWEEVELTFRAAD
jgi:hypothetical protein